MTLRAGFAVAVGFALSMLSACVASPGDHPPSAPSALSPEAAAVVEECRTPTQQAAGDEASASTDTGLQLISISPPVGSLVTRSTVLVADLAYAVTDFTADQFTILAQFDSPVEHRTTEGSFKSHPYLQSASGSYRLCFPLTDIWDRDVKRPLSVRFVLNRVDESHRNHAVARTEKLSYRVE